MTPNRRKYLLFSLFAVVALVLDQWTKVLARQYLRPRGPFHPKVIIEHYFDLRYAENPGVAFSMLTDIPGWVLSLFALGALAAVVITLRKMDSDNARLHVALGLVGGGAIGNLLDRVLYGRVTDFVVWKVNAHEWPAFNVADAALCVGVGLLVLDMFKKPRTQAPPASA